MAASKGPGSPIPADPPAREDVLKENDVPGRQTVLGEDPQNLKPSDPALVIFSQDVPARRGDELAAPPVRTGLGAPPLEPVSFPPAAPPITPAASDAGGIEPVPVQVTLAMRDDPYDLSRGEAGSQVAGDEPRQSWWKRVWRGTSASLGFLLAPGRNGEEKGRNNQ